MHLSMLMFLYREDSCTTQVSVGNARYPSFAHFYSQLGVITEYSWTHVTYKTHLYFSEMGKGKSSNYRKNFLIFSIPYISTLKNWKILEKTKNTKVLASEFNFTDTYAETEPVENLCICFRDFLRFLEQSHKTCIYWEKILQDLNAYTEVFLQKTSKINVNTKF